MTNRPVVVSAEDTTTFLAFGEELTMHLGHQDTGGRVSLFMSTTPPGGGPPPHYHTVEDEWFFPLEGRVEFFFDGKWTEVAMGSAVFMPKKEVHAFRNPGDQPLKMLIQTAPAGIESFFKRCAEEFSKPNPPEFARIAAIGNEHGIYFVS